MKSLRRSSKNCDLQFANSDRFKENCSIDINDMLNDSADSKRMAESTSGRSFEARKRPREPNEHRRIALLFSLYKLLERMILTRLQCKIERKLIPQQAGFRPGKSCCSQVLNLTQHIEDGFDLGQITGAAFIDLKTAQL